VTLRLKAVEKQAVPACGSPHRTARYAVGGPVRFAGTSGSPVNPIATF